MARGQSSSTQRSSPRRGRVGRPATAVGQCRRLSSIGGEHTVSLFLRRGSITVGILLPHLNSYPASVASRTPAVNADSSNSMLGNRVVRTGDMGDSLSET